MLALSIGLLSGCASNAVYLPAAERHSVDRSVVEYPPGYRLQTIVRELRAPTAITFDQEGSLIVADRGLEDEPVIVGFRANGTKFDIYPRKKQLFTKGNIRGPVGGMVAAYGRIYVFHRDVNRRGVITAFDYDGKTQTVVADMPAEEDNCILDLVLNRNDGRLYFAIGSITNSGVVGLDNWAQGWVSDMADACDHPAIPYKLLGYRFDTPNPRSGLFGGNDIAVTSPFQPFGRSQQTWIKPSSNDKATAAIFSVGVNGGDLRIEAHGIRHAAGLAFNDFGRLYAANQGMELRGTRPVKDDPDAIIRIIRNVWYGWPDFSTDLQPITEKTMMSVGIPFERLVRRAQHREAKFGQRPERL